MLTHKRMPYLTHWYQIEMDVTFFLKGLLVREVVFCIWAVLKFDVPSHHMERHDFLLEKQNDVQRITVYYIRYKLSYIKILNYHI